jgi:hypothetical protein
MGRPFVDGSRVAVEWWTTMVDDGDEVTLPGCLLLTFEADGRDAPATRLDNLRTAKAWLGTKGARPQGVGSGTHRDAIFRASPIVAFVGARRGYAPVNGGFRRL